MTRPGFSHLIFSPFERLNSYLDCTLIYGCHSTHGLIVELHKAHIWKCHRDGDEEREKEGEREIESVRKYKMAWFKEWWWEMCALFATQHKRVTREREKERKNFLFAYRMKVRIKKSMILWKVAVASGKSIRGRPEALRTTPTAVLSEQ